MSSNYNREIKKSLHIHTNVSTHRITMPEKNKMKQKPYKYKHIKDLNQKWYQNLISKWAWRKTERERRKKEKPFIDDTQFFNIDFWIHIIDMINKQRENIQRKKETEMGEGKRRKKRVLVNLMHRLYRSDHISYLLLLCVHTCDCVKDCHLHLRSFSQARTANRDCSIL